MDKERDLIIPLTGREPVAIHSEEWPIIASSTITETVGGLREYKKWYMSVRQHADGRAIAYAAFHGPDGRDFTAGVLTIASDGVPEAILRVESGFVTALHRNGLESKKAHHLATACMSQLPPTEI